MDMGSLDYIEECDSCGCAYFEYESEDKILRTQYLCKRCKKEHHKGVK